MPPDSDLLRQYARHRDEAAFAEVVRRHVNLVHATALRLLNGDAHLAQDVTQAVFAELARQAAKLGGHPTVAGWLHTTARFLASKTVRTERRRRAREQEAIAMTDSPSADPELWEQLRPLLDEAVARLDATDRDALLLRFFEGKNHREVAGTLNLNEDAARMRISRALDKLREQFSRRGVATTAALLGTALGVHGAPAAPAAFAATVAAKSLTVAATSAGAGVWAWFSLRSYVIWGTATVIAGFAAVSFWPHPSTGGPVVSVPRIASFPAASPSKPTATSLPTAAPSLAALPSPPIGLPPPIAPIVPPDSTASPPVIATPPTPADSPVPTPAEDLTAPAVARLEAVRAALDRAAINLRSATSATHGGFVEKGRADLAPAFAAANAALDFACANPASSVQPATISPASDATLVRLNGVHQPTPNSQPSMHRTLAALKSALEVLQSVPGGDLGGARETIISSVAQTTNDVIAGIRFADQDATAKFSPPLYFATGPANAVAAIRVSLQSPSISAWIRRNGIADLDTLTVIQPLARFRLPDRNTIIIGGLEAATAAGFFYPILFGDREAMGADVPNKGTGGTADLGHIIVSFVGPKDMNETVTDALNHLSTLKRIHEGLYEVRLLEFRYPAEGNLSKAIWLKSANGSVGSRMSSNALPESDSGVF